jgi:hypothetical protein
MAKSVLPFAYIWGCCCTLGACQDEAASPEPPYDPEYIVAIEPLGPVSLALGQSMPVRLDARTATGAPIPRTVSIRFRSTKASVVTVSGSGVATAHQLGWAYVVGELTGTDSPAPADSVRVEVSCTAELRYRFDPPAKTLVQGESFAPQVSLSTCGGLIAVTDVITWESLDSTVVRIDGAGQTATGIEPGTTHLQARGRHYGLVGGIPVTVTP